MLMLAPVAVAAFVGPQAVATIAPDRDAPSLVRRILPDAKRVLAGQLDLWPASIRYTGMETRRVDELVILQFEVRAFPFFAVDRAYLASRCTPLADLDPAAMGGGRGVTDFATDAELEHLRSDAQPPCPGGS